MLVSSERSRACRCSEGKSTSSSHSWSCRRPFQREPDFDAASVLPLQDLLARGGGGRAHVGVDGDYTDALEGLDADRID